MRKKILIISIILILGGFLMIIAGLVYAKKSPRPGYENEHFRIRLRSPTPDQITAFYTGRGFPQSALKILRQTCFIGIGMGNKGKQKVWLDLSSWTFETSKGPLKRILRSDWQATWKQIGLEKRFQSTFRWTLMPEQLDFHPHEGEGGNITFPYTHEPITIKAKVAVGNNKESSYDITIPNVRCAKQS